MRRGSGRFGAWWRPVWRFPGWCAGDFCGGGRAEDTGGGASRDGGSAFGAASDFLAGGQSVRSGEGGVGRLLYYDVRLSSDGTVSCASCHEPDHGFTDGQAVSTGIGGQQGGRSAPTVINRAYTLLQFWDGRALSLEDQVKGPLANPLEMTSEKTSNEAHEAVVKRINGIPGYIKRFRQLSLGMVTSRLIMLRRRLPRLSGRCSRGTPPMTATRLGTSRP